MDTHLSGARRTVALNRRSCTVYGMPDTCTDRLREGLSPDRYGPTNHLQPEFNNRRETAEELFDAFNGVDMLESRLEHLGVTIGPDARARLHEARLAIAQAFRHWELANAMLAAQERDAGPDWDCYAPGQRKCHSCEGQCLTEG